MLTTHPPSPLQTVACAMLAPEPVAAGQAINTASKQAFGTLEYYPGSMKDFIICIKANAKRFGVRIAHIAAQGHRHSQPRDLQCNVKTTSTSKFM